MLYLIIALLQIALTLGVLAYGEYAQDQSIEEFESEIRRLRE